MSQIQPAYLVQGLRTPVAKAFGVFQHVRPDDLLAAILRELVAQTKIDPHEIDDIIIGCAMPEAEQGMNVARIATLLADLPDSVPAMTINRFCSSGVQTVALAAQQIMLGQADMIIAGGVESMSKVPLGGYTFRGNPHYFDHQHQHEEIAYAMGITAEIVAQKYEISRERQDEFALASHQKAIKAITEGEFKQEILPYTVNNHLVNTIQETTITQDTGPRADSNLQKLARLKPVFAAKGSVTAGNSSQMSDGAGAVLLVSEKILKQYQLTPMAKLLGYSVAGVAPEVMGIGPIAAIPKVLKQAKLNLAQIDWIELNEAFAAQSLAVIDHLKMDIDKVNPLGGAIALGHPLGATGAIKTATAIHALQRHQLQYAMVTMCIGTGMGAAAIFERC